MVVAVVEKDLNGVRASSRPPRIRPAHLGSVGTDTRLGHQSGDLANRDGLRKVLDERFRVRLVMSLDDPDDSSRRLALQVAVILHLQDDSSRSVAQGASVGRGQVYPAAGQQRFLLTALCMGIVDGCSGLFSFVESLHLGLRGCVQIDCRNHLEHHRTFYQLIIRAYGIAKIRS